ncbi:MAG: multicopper oxidase domain-containing protein [Verrucomicrobia bacterium]|nr:multicopper oxidase domain-containing protein [Verrucomicrobiota bacterium]
MLKQLLSVLLLLTCALSATPVATYGPCKETAAEPIRLKIIETTITVKGKPATVFDVLAPNDSRILTRKEGECFNVLVENKTSRPTSLHWHGFILPTLEDGVPFLNQSPILPGKTYPYNFKVVQTGTYYAHSHFGLQEQKLMSIPILLLPQENALYRDIVVFLEDFTFKSLKEVWQGLRKQYIAMAKEKGSGWKPDLMMKASGPPDLFDVQYDAFLANRKTLEAPDVMTVYPGEEVRLRLINASSSTDFHISLGGLSGKVIAVDGNPVEPIPFDRFPLATAQRMDVIVTIPKEGGAFPILAQGQGTNMVAGIILKTNGAKIPSLSMQMQTTAGAITNAIETKLRPFSPLQPKPVDRTLVVELEGNMKFYTWALNQKVWPDIQPLSVKEGERVEISFVNKTGMSHPMHLHGHVFQVVEIDGKRFSGAVRDTVLVMPQQTVKVQFDANNPGIWALHCHIAYHMWAGMFTVLQYEGFTPPYFSPDAIQKYSRIYGGY